MIPVHPNTPKQRASEARKGPWKLSLGSQDFVKEVTTGLCVSVVLWPGAVFREVPSRSGVVG